MIPQFTAEYAYLSNFHPCEVQYEGVLYPSSENCYQAAKTLSIEERIPFVSMTASKSKRAGRKVTLRPDWNEVKLDVMYAIVLDKFTRNADLKAKLLATGNETLVETNFWNDVYWGICHGKGENHLGKILMKVRDILR